MKTVLKLVQALFLIIAICSHAFAQDKLDRFIDDLLNDNLRYELVKVGTSQLKSDNKIVLPKTVIVVKSVDIKSVLSKYKKKVLIRRLTAALDNPDKDWYANILLYAITERDATSLIAIEGKSDWIISNKKKDAEYWNKYGNKKVK